MPNRRTSSRPKRFRVEVGHAAVCVEGASLEEAIREARRRFCLDMPRLWDLIQSLDVSRFRVRSLPSTEDR